MAVLKRKRLDRPDALGTFGALGRPPVLEGAEVSPEGTLLAGTAAFVLLFGLGIGSPSRRLMRSNGRTVPAGSGTGLSSRTSARASACPWQRYSDLCP